MTLGERCDEIVRLIDATLADYAESASATAGGREAATVGEAPPVTRARALAEKRRPGLRRSA